jgi:bacterioferritin-associated ferredoxin
MYVCICKAVTDAMLEKCIEENSCTKFSHVAKNCRAGTQCGKCIPWIKSVLKENREKMKHPE